MKKICLIFRGQHERYRDGYMDASDNLDNWNKTIFNPLKKLNIEYDIIFLTYDTYILPGLVSSMKPKKIILYDDKCELYKDSGYSQKKSFEDSIKIMKENICVYDRYIILRFDLLYRLPITEWNKWNEKGIILVNKDVYWPVEHLYTDMVFIVDKDSIYKFIFAVEGINNLPHDIGKNLYEHNIEFHIMYDTIHDVDCHPLYMRASYYKSDTDLYNINNYICRQPVILDENPWYAKIYGKK